MTLTWLSGRGPCHPPRCRSFAVGLVARRVVVAFAVSIENLLQLSGVPALGLVPRRVVVAVAAGERDAAHQEGAENESAEDGLHHRYVSPTNRTVMAECRYCVRAVDYFDLPGSQQ